MSARESIIPIFVPHSGCPHQCVFCDQRRITGARKSADAETVRAAVNAAQAIPAGKRQLAFYGGSFTAIPEREQEELLSAAKEALSAGLISAIRLSTRPDAIDDAVLSRLKYYGVETVELGAQSMEDEVLALSGRGHTAAQVAEAAHAVKAAGFRLILQMMTGLPGDTPERSLSTAEKLIALQPDGVRIYPTVIVRGTELWELWQAGLYREHTVEDAVALCARLLPLFEKAGIPVIRLGLNPTEELTSASAAGGAYHPALGELVKSRVFLLRAQELLAGRELQGSVTLGVHPAKVSQMTGQHRCNIAALKERFRLTDVKIQGVPDLPADGIAVL